MITLRESDHTYWRGTVRVPGFSEICASMRVGEKDCGDCVKGIHHAHHANFYTEEGRAVGVATHSWLNFLAQGNEPDAAPDPRIAGRVEAIRKFLRETGFKYAGGEEPQYEPVLGYACQPDLWGYIGAFSYVIDAKAGANLKVHALQTGAQRIALAANGFKAQKRAGLYLQDDGEYRLKEHTNTANETHWRAIVSGYNAKQFYL